MLAADPILPADTGCDSAGLYIHVPFCRRRCPYCDFYSTTDLARIPEYVEGLIREIGFVRENKVIRDLSGIAGIPDVGAPQGAAVFDTVYLGGGTPSLLQPDQVARILNAARAAFRISPDAEITLEANPGTVSAQTLQGYLAAGVNRLHLGVQSFSDDRLEFLGRIHNGREAVAAAEMARAAGFENLGIDLIYGLPGQTPAEWVADMDRALALSPAHLSCYLLTCEAGTLLDHRRRGGRFTPLSEERAAGLFYRAETHLARKGFHRYEISNFAARPSTRSRHNMKYWRGAPYIGLGPAAHSHAGGLRWWNHKSLPRYLSDARAGKSPVAGREALGRDQMMTEAIFLGLRTADGIDVGAFDRRFGVDFGACFDGALGDLMAAGLVTGLPENCRLTRRGMAFSDHVARQFCMLL